MTSTVPPGSTSPRRFSLPVNAGVSRTSPCNSDQKHRDRKLGIGVATYDEERSRPIAWCKTAADGTR
jgi:hypothetical protein